MTGGTGDGASEDGAPLISVVITNYNYGRYLGTAIRSVLGQTYGRVQCIVVDDGSSDDSVAVARSFPEVELVAKANGGQVSAVKAGLDHVAGELLIFLDADDLLYPQACATLAAAFDPAVTLYQFGLDIVDQEGARIGAYPDRPLLKTGQKDYLLRHGFFPSSPTSGNAFQTAHVRRMMAECGSDLRYFIDGYLIFSAPFFGDVRPIDAVLGSYLVHGGNVSLSAGINKRSAEKSLRNSVWQRNGIINALRMTGRPIGGDADHLPVWALRHLLILRRCYGVTDILPESSDRAIAVRAAAKALRVPNASLLQRARNIGLIVALMLGDCRLGRRVVPLPPEAG